MSKIAHVQDGTCEVRGVHFFTAPAKEAFASHGKDSVVAQQSYHRALEAKYSDTGFRIVLGNHSYDKAGTLMPRYVPEQGCDKSDRIRVWKLEEKQTDVNLALAMYRACCKNQCDQVIVCSNDSDVEPVLAAIREDFSAVRIGVVTPAAPGDSHRRYSKSLANQAHWVRRHIADNELAAAQLPNHVATRKKPATKPAHW